MHQPTSSKGSFYKSDLPSASNTPPRGLQTVGSTTPYKNSSDVLNSINSPDVVYASVEAEPCYHNSLQDVKKNWGRLIAAMVLGLILAGIPTALVIIWVTPLFVPPIFVPLWIISTMAIYVCIRQPTVRQTIYFDINKKHTLAEVVDASLDEEHAPIVQAKKDIHIKRYRSNSINSPHNFNTGKGGATPSSASNSLTLYSPRSSGNVTPQTPQTENLNSTESYNPSFQ